MAETKKRLQRLKAIRNGHRNVLTKLVQEGNELVFTDSSGANQLERIDVINSVLEGKLRAMNESDQILSSCELTVVDKDIQESEEIVTEIIDCRRKIKKAKSKTSTF